MIYSRNFSVIDFTMPRTSKIERQTLETQISLSLNLDGVGKAEVDTGIGFFDHMLTLIAKHALLDLEVKAKGDLEVDFHHTVEDVGICLGSALSEALGDKVGINRYGFMYLPMDETLSRAVIDLSNRPFIEFRVSSNMPASEGFPMSLVEEFFRAIAFNLRCNLHLECLYGRDGHHISESLFKGFARALKIAASNDPRQTGVPSSKGSLS